jgi:hypothetical protein
MATSAGERKCRIYRSHGGHGERHVIAPLRQSRTAWGQVGEMISPRLPHAVRAGVANPYLGISPPWLCGSCQKAVAVEHSGSTNRSHEEHGGFGDSGRDTPVSVLAPALETLGRVGELVSPCLPQSFQHWCEQLCPCGAVLRGSVAPVRKLLLSTAVRMRPVRGVIRLIARISRLGHPELLHSSPVAGTRPAPSSFFNDSDPLKLNAA